MGPPICPREQATGQELEGAQVGLSLHNSYALWTSQQSYFSSVPFTDKGDKQEFQEHIFSRSKANT